MNSAFVKRSFIIEKLKLWEIGSISRSELYEWASNIYIPGSIDFDDWEGVSDNSIANEVMSRIDMFDIDNCGKEVIPIFIEFLETPLGQFSIGLENFLSKYKTTE